MRYEDLNADTASALKAAFGHVQDTAVDDCEIEASIGRYDFERQTNRKPGTVLPLPAKRQRTISGWKNYLLDGTKAHFYAMCGDWLRASGYQSD
jgi:hypothetical protein